VSIIVVVLSDKGGCAAKPYLELEGITFSENATASAFTVVRRRRTAGSFNQQANGWISKKSRPK
jgi:hypothetical protein